MARQLTAFIFAAVLLLSTAAAAQPEPTREQTANMLALNSKRTASVVFVSGRTVEDYFEIDLKPASRGLLQIDDIKVQIDRARRALLVWFLFRLIH